MKLSRFQLFPKRGIWARKLTQFLFFTLIAFISVNHTLVRNGGGFDFLSSASLHALCPFGGVETMAQLLTSGTLIKKVRDSSVILLDLGKGELASNTALAKQLNANVLRVPEEAIPLDMFHRNEDSDNPAHVLQAFRDSFERAMISKPGAKQLDAFREALKPLFIHQDHM